MSVQYLLSIDQGTTGTTVLIIDASDPVNLSVVGRSTIDFTQYFPNTGWVEHDLEEIWRSVKLACQNAINEACDKKSDFRLNDIVGIGITNQRETLCVFERKTSKPLCKAIVWQCKRSLDCCEKLRKENWGEFVSDRTGLVLDPYFSGSKILWVMENNKEISRAVQNGTAVFGTIDTYLIHRLTGAKEFVTEPSNASRTLLYNIKQGRFDNELASLFKIQNLNCLPQVKNSSGFFGSTKSVGFLPDGIPIAGVLGDQQAALAGQACFDIGEAKCTYGTGAFLLLNTGDNFLRSKSGLLSTVAWSYKNKLTYAMEGSSFIAGAAVQFLRDQLNFIGSARETEDIAFNVTGAPEIYFVPALVGLGAPYWNPSVRGAILGLTRGTSKAQIVRAVLEGIAFQVYELLNAMREDFPVESCVLKVDGGAASNNLLMQIQADLANVNVDRPINLETTAMGAALFAGLGVGIYSDLKDLKNVRKSDRMFFQDKGKEALELRRIQINGWNRAIRAIEVFSQKDD